MNLADLLIVAVLVVSVVAAFVKGFFVEVFSLAGVLFGLFFAAANYGRLAPWILRLVQNHVFADCSGGDVAGEPCRTIVPRHGAPGGPGDCRSIVGGTFRVGQRLCCRHARPDGRCGISSTAGLAQELQAGASLLDRSPWRLSCCTVCFRRKDSPGPASAPHGAARLVETNYADSIRHFDTGHGGKESSSIGWCETNTNLAVERVGKGKRFL